MFTKLKNSIRKATKIGLFTSLKTIFNKEQKNSIIAKKFIKKYGKDIGDIYSDYCRSVHNNYTPQNNIFIFWYQTNDITELPPCARMCIKRIYELYEREYKIHFVCKNNLENYIEVSPKITKLLETNKINIQNFSDYIRFKLVNKYGGFWIDTTVLFKEHYDLNFFNKNYPFYSLNCNATRSFLYDDEDKARHCARFFSARKDSPITYVFYKFFETYYEKNKTQFGYFMVDYVMFSLYKIPDLKSIFYNIPESDINPNNIVSTIKSGINPLITNIEKIEKLSNRIIDDKLVEIILKKLK